MKLRSLKEFMTKNSLKSSYTLTIDLFYCLTRIFNFSRRYFEGIKENMSFLMN
jgi:hypothetical protein